MKNDGIGLLLNPLCLKQNFSKCQFSWKYDFLRFSYSFCNFRYMYITTQVLSLFLQIWVLLGKHLLLQIVLQLLLQHSGICEKRQHFKTVKRFTKMTFVSFKTAYPREWRQFISKKKQSTSTSTDVLYTKAGKNTFFLYFLPASLLHTSTQTHFLARLRLKSSFQGMFFLIHQRRK